MIPLAERMRPQSLDDYLGQEHLTEILKRMVASGQIPSMILWGPPGVGKTTLAGIIAQTSNRPFFNLSAINSGVKDVRETIKKAEQQRFFDRPGPLLFIDEIHRFSKSQQDALLGAVEKGTITLIGATTENPSFEVIPALLSRCQVYVLRPLNKERLIELLHKALQTDLQLKDRDIQLKEAEALLRFSGGDARKLYNALEIVTAEHATEAPLVITNAGVEEKIQQNLARYDKSGEQHYDIVSAFIKSVRGSDPQAAVYWLARMLAGGEDIRFIARRLLILAAEDVGLANPNALLIAQNAFQAINVVGMPEARIILSQATIYLAASAKSNAAYLAIDQAMDTVKQTGDLPVPLYLRNAPTNLMKELDYGQDYLYAHDFPGHFVEQEYLPTELSGAVFYRPQQNPAEARLKNSLEKWWKEKYTL